MPWWRRDGLRGHPGRHDGPEAGIGGSQASPERVDAVLRQVGHATPYTVELLQRSGMLGIGGQPFLQLGFFLGCQSILSAHRPACRGHVDGHLARDEPFEIQRIGIGLG